MGNINSSFTENPKKQSCHVFNLALTNDLAFLTVSTLTHPHSKEKGIGTEAATPRSYALNVLVWDMLAAIQSETRPGCRLWLSTRHRP